jgi:two-component system response regulator HydG
MGIELLTAPQATLPSAATPVPHIRLLCVGNEPEALRDLARCAEQEGALVARARDEAAALAALGQGGWHAALLVLGPDPEPDLVRWTGMLRRAPHPPRLAAVLPSPSVGFAVRAAELGVVDVLPVPVRRDHLRGLIRSVRVADAERVLPLPEARTLWIGSQRMVAESPAMLPVFQAIAQVAPTTATVLIVGESGTGKELVARAIHQFSPRASRPFVAVNSGAIPESLLESELFGHEPGAFTDAVGRKIGRFERAGGGTLFLDEIGDMSLALQSKILRAVQDREIERIGGEDPIPVDVRLVAATHRDLKALMREGHFREDLYYRLAVVTVGLPRLADRAGDLPALASCFVKEFGEQCGKTFTGITDQALAVLRQRDWPGNVRELRNVIERAVLLAPGPVLRVEHLLDQVRDTSPDEQSAPPLASLREIKVRHIQRVLEQTGGHISHAARILGVHHNTVARKIREHGL